MAGPVVDVLIARPEKLRKFADGLKELDKKAIEDTLVELQEFGGQFLNYAKLQSPVREGKFRNALEVKVRKSGDKIGELRMTYRPGTDRPKKLLQWIIQGTGIYGPHKTPIRPKRKPFLAWKGPDGKWRYAKTVRGMKPRDFIGSAWDTAMESRELLKKRVGRMIVRRLIEGRT